MSLGIIAMSVSACMLIPGLQQSMEIVIQAGRAEECNVARPGEALLGMIKRTML